jgi:arginyl-tRNA synthetase
VAVAGPGFLNITFHDQWYIQAVQDWASQPVLGKPVEKPEKIVVEYVSANPSGPMHIGNLRGGPIGETLARVLAARGHEVTRDFYINDIGGQADLFAQSVLHFIRLHAGRDSVLPEKGYPAPYVEEVAHAVEEAFQDRLDEPESDILPAVRVAAVGVIVAGMRATCERLGIHFDTWSAQSELVTSGRSSRMLELLKERGTTVDRDGAIWLASGIQDDDRESVLVKSDGNGTYFLDDLAFYQMKLEEWGNVRGVCVLGGNHSGHIPRMQAGLQAAGINPERYQAVLYQQVQLIENGQVRTMSKRAGTFVMADELLDELPRDVVTWFMVSKANESHLDFDLTLAKDTSDTNPVYSVQYAHARICSLLSQSVGEVTAQPYNGEVTADERALLRHLAVFPELLQEVAMTFRTNLIPTYLVELAARYHRFYAHHRILGEEPSLSAFRLQLSARVAETVRTGLGLINVSAPERMEKGLAQEN